MNIALLHRAVVLRLLYFFMHYLDHALFKLW